MPKWLQHPSKSIKNQAKGDQGAVDSLIYGVLVEGRKGKVFVGTSPVAPKIRKIGPTSDRKAQKPPRDFGDPPSR